MRNTALVIIGLGLWGIAWPGAASAQATEPEKPPPFMAWVNLLPRPAETMLELGYLRPSLEERYPAGGADFDIPFNDAFSASLRQRWSESWSSGLEIRRWASYQIIDDALSGSTHSRTETWMRLAAHKTYRWFGVPHQLGLGYALRHVGVENSFATPTPSYLFSTRQLFHGLELDDRLVVPLWGPLDAIAGVMISPLTLAHLDAGVPEMGLLYRFGGELGLSARIGRAFVRTSYRMEQVRRFDGPFQVITSPEFAVGFHF